MGRLRFPSGYHSHRAYAGIGLSEKALLAAAEEVVRPFLHVAKRYMTTRARHQSLDEPNLDPRGNLQMASPDRISLILRIPVPTRHRGKLEQEVTRRYLKILEEMKKPPTNRFGFKPRFQSKE